MLWRIDEVQWISLSPKKWMHALRIQLQGMCLHLTNWAIKSKGGELECIVFISDFSQWQLMYMYCTLAWFTWSISCRRNWLVSCNTSAQRSGSLLRTRYLARLLNNEFSLQTLKKKGETIIHRNFCRDFLQYTCQTNKYSIQFTSLNMPGLILSYRL